MDVRPHIYAGHDSVIVRVPIGRRLVRAVVSREVLESHFNSGRTREDWVETYRAHAEMITAVVQDKVSKASPEPVLISKHDF